MGGWGDLGGGYVSGWVQVGSRLHRRSDTLGQESRVASEGECCTYQGLSDRYPRNESSSVHGKIVNGKS